LEKPGVALVATQTHLITFWLTARLIRQVLGAVPQFEKVSLVA
jgi:hypothetical protein